MAEKKFVYPLRFRDNKQKADFEKICLASGCTMRFVLLKLIDEINAKKRRVGLLP